MKFKMTFILFTLILLGIAQAQVLENAGTLRTGKMNLGVFLTDYENDDLGIFVNGGYGLGPGYDLGLRLGLGYHETYLGANVEWLLKGGKPAISLAAGAHVFGDLGLDGTLNLTIPASRQINIYTGLDLDINFVERRGEKDTQVPLWLPLGVEIGLKTNIALLIEVEFDVGDDAWTIFSAGVNFSF
jgi:hypothetical protein